MNRLWMTRTVGREDRLVRAAVALSLLLIGAFVVLASGGPGASSLIFGALLAYFLLTAALGWDPLYARAGIDTRTEAEAGDYVVDLREGSWRDLSTASDAGAATDR